MAVERDIKQQKSEETAEKRISSRKAKKQQKSEKSIEMQINKATVMLLYVVVRQEYPSDIFCKIR